MKDCEYFLNIHQKRNNYWIFTFWNSNHIVLDIEDLIYAEFSNYIDDYGSYGSQYSSGDYEAYDKSSKNSSEINFEKLRNQLLGYCDIYNSNYDYSSFSTIDYSWYYDSDYHEKSNSEYGQYDFVDSSGGKLKRHQTRFFCKFEMIPCFS